MDALSMPPEGSSFADTLTSTQWDWVLDFWSLELEDDISMLFQAPKFVRAVIRHEYEVVKGYSLPSV